MKRLLAAAAAIGAALFLVAAPAHAADQGQVTPGAFCSPQGDTGHTSTGLAMVCTTTPTDSRARWRAASTAAAGSGTPTTQDFGSAAVGGTVSGTLCGYPANTAGTWNVNGTGGLSGTTDANGCKHLTVQITSRTTGLLGDPVSVTTQCGTNTITGTAGGATQSATFTEVCAVAVPSSASPSSVAFTGANVARWSVSGAGLVAVGFGLVTVARRRRAA